MYILDFYSWQRDRNNVPEIKVVENMDVQKWYVGEKKCSFHTLVSFGNNYVITPEIPNVLEIQKLTKSPSILFYFIFIINSFLI